MKASEKLKSKIEKGLHFCVGLDPDLKKIPKHLLNSDDPILEFNKQIIEKTVEETAAYKLNFAFFESLGGRGFETLNKTVELIPSDILIIGDAKRGDIGNTSKMYAQSLFDHFKFDASTLNPYMGIDSVKPFLDYEGKLNFILALTSNSSAEDFEKLKLENGKMIFQEVIEKVKSWNTNNNCGLVFGATNLSELTENISSFDGMPILLPGIGAQGGSLEEVVKVFKSAQHSQFLINSSRAIIYADNSLNFAAEAGEVLKKYNKSVQNIEI